MRLNHARIRRALAENTVKAFSKFYTGKKNIPPNDIDEIASENVFFVTLKGDERRARAVKAQTIATRPGLEPTSDPRPYTDVGFEFTELNHIMNEMNRRIYSAKWHRDPALRALLPVSYFFLDFDGSRYCERAPALRDIKGIHLHGVIGFPTSHMQRAQEVLPTLIRDITAKHPLMMDRGDGFVPFDPSKVTSERGNRSAFEVAVQYAAKGAAHLWADGWPIETWREYPNPNGLTYGYPSPPIGSPDRRVPFENAEVQAPAATT